MFKQTLLSLCLLGGLCAPALASEPAPALAVDVEKLDQEPETSLKMAQTLLKKAGIKDIKAKGWSVFAFKDGYSLMFRILPDEKTYIIVVSGKELKTGMEILKGFKMGLSKAKPQAPASSPAPQS